jgi:4-diphosphocytidyl-2-C-methyl-D-erythritol kinase
VFAAYADERAARAALDGLPAEWRGFVAAGLSRSPLVERCAANPGRG